MGRSDSRCRIESDDGDGVRGENAMASETLPGVRTRTVEGG